MLRVWLLSWVSLVWAVAPGAAFDLGSPDGQIVLRAGVKEHLEPYPGGSRPYLSVEYQGHDLLLDSPLGLDFRDAPPLARGLLVEEQTTRRIDESWQAVVGKSREVRDRCNEMRLRLRETEPPGRRLDLVFRAYDDGVAFRYEIPEQPGIGEFRLAAERTELHFAGDHTAWAADYGSFTTSQEKEFERITLDAIRPSSVVGLPLLVQAGDAAWVAVTEADLRDWAGLYLAGHGTSPHTLVSRLSPRPDEPGTAVRGHAPHRSPWRVLMIADHPGRLIESNLVLNLSQPLALADTSWIQPGRSAWDRWWSGDYIPDADFPVGMNTATMKRFTDLAAEMGWEYVLVDWGWYGPITDFATGGERDATRVIPELDLPELVRYAHERGVKVLLWVFWTHLDQKLDQALATYEKWGISGIKVDFMNRDDQEMVAWYEKVVRKAAEHRLVVDFHGAFKPTGLRRAYPNLLTREGVLGNEYNKWSDRVTPLHKLTLPFTRMLAGPMDFTPGGFRHATPSVFVAQDSRPFVNGTRAQELAELVVYESPLQVLCDAPAAYHDGVGARFLREVPTTWDETRVLDGMVGERIVIARRSGRRWFLGAMAGEAAQQVRVPLSFLGDGTYRSYSVADAEDAFVRPERAVESETSLKSQQTLEVKLAPGGGYVAILTPEE